MVCLLLSLAVVLVAQPVLAQLTQPPPSCTDCWCVPEDGPQGKCPYLKNRQPFPPGYSPDIIDKFRSLKLVGDQPIFSPPQCQPFPEVAGTFNQFLPPVQQIPICQEPTDVGEKAVCAFFYEEDDCLERSTYKMTTFESSRKAEKAGWIVTHRGQCGVCSNAQDLAANLAPDLDVISFNCGLLLIEGPPQAPLDFLTNIQASIQCFMEEALMTQQCAYLWASNGLQVIFGSTPEFPKGCAQICQTIQAPPQDENCNLNECLACDEAVAGPFFKKFSGRTRRNSGILGVLKRDCDSVANIRQDPCDVSEYKSAKVTKKTKKKPSMKKMSMKKSKQKSKHKKNSV